MRGQYNSLSSEDDSEEILRPVRLSTSFDVESPHSFSSVDISHQRKHRWTLYAGFLVVVTLVIVIAVQMSSSGSNSSTSDYGSKKKEHKHNDTTLIEDAILSSNFRECRTHCHDPCIESPKVHKVSFCCEWDEGTFSTRTCSQTFSSSGKCYCTGSAVDQFLSLHRPTAAPVTHQPTRTPKPSPAPTVSVTIPSAIPSIPPWTQYIPDQYNPYKTPTQTPSAEPTFLPTERPTSSTEQDPHDAASSPQVVQDVNIEPMDAFDRMTKSV